MFKPNIRRRVMVIIDEIIDDAQREHDADLVVMEERHKTEKSQLSDKAVEKVIAGVVKRK